MYFFFYLVRTCEPAQHPNYAINSFCFNEGEGEGTKGKGKQKKAVDVFGILFFFSKFA